MSGWDEGTVQAVARAIDACLTVDTGSYDIDGIEEAARAALAVIPERPTTPDSTPEHAATDPIRDALDYLGRVIRIQEGMRPETEQVIANAHHRLDSIDLAAAVIPEPPSDADAWVIATALNEWAESEEEYAADQECPEDAAEIRRQAAVAPAEAARPCERCNGGGWLLPEPFQGYGGPGGAACPECFGGRGTLAQLREKATPGPWTVTWDSCDCGDGYPCGHSDYISEVNGVGCAEDWSDDDLLYAVACVNAVARAALAVIPEPPSDAETVTEWGVRMPDGREAWTGNKTEAEWWVSISEGEAITRTVTYGPTLAAPAPEEPT